MGTPTAKWNINSVNSGTITTTGDTAGINDWKFSITDLGTMTAVDETANISTTEIELPLTSPGTGDVAADTSLGARVITLGSGEGATFNVGSKITFNVGGTDYYNAVTAITGDSLTLKYALSIAVPATTTVDESGKSGDYAFVVDPAAITTQLVLGGTYAITASSALAGIDNATQTVRGVDYDIDVELGSDIKAIKKGIDNISAGTVVNASIQM